MKFILSSVLLLASFIFPSTQPENVASFNIEIERSGDSIRMKCTQGCKWTQLKFKMNSRNPVVVNEFGVYTKAAYDNQPKGDFAFYLKRIPFGLNFTSILGTAWEGLSFARKPARKMYLNETGVSTKK